MKSALVAIAASALASVASAQMLFYGYPISSSVWDLSKPASLYVQWTNDCKNLTDGTVFNIALNVQNAAGQQVAAPGVTGPIGELDCKSKGKVSVTLPDTIPSGNQYSIYVNNGGTQSYSALFSILNAKVPAPSTVAPTTTVAATTSAVATTTAGVNATTIAATKTVTTTSPTASTKPNNAGALKVGSTAALVIVAAAAGLML